MRVSRLELSPASRSRSERGGAWFLGGLSGGCDSAPARCLKQSDLRKEAKETSNAAYRYCNSAESSAGVSPASSAISFNRHPRLFLARRRSPGFLTGRKRSVQAWITGLWEPCSGARRNFRLRKKSGCPKRAACVGEVLRGGG